MGVEEDIWKGVQDNIINAYWRATEQLMFADYYFCWGEDKEVIKLDVESIERTESDLRECFASPLSLDVFNYCIENADWDEKVVFERAPLRSKLKLGDVKERFPSTSSEVLEDCLNDMKMLDLLEETFPSRVYLSTVTARTLYEILNSNSRVL